MIDPTCDMTSAVSVGVTTGTVEQSVEYATDGVVDATTWQAVEFGTGDTTRWASQEAVREQMR